MEKIPNIIKVAIIVPCYNEEEVLEDTAQKLKILTERLESREAVPQLNFVIVFVDDGSKDRTWHIIESLNQGNSQYKGLKLSANAGHQKALLAGLLEFQHKADCLISIDADLQDDIDAIEEMLNRYIEGNDVVYGVRRERKTDTWFKRFTAHLFNKLMMIMGVEIIYNHADFRLASSRVIQALAQYREVNLFLRGIFPAMGFKTAVVEYDRKERLAGTTKYPLKKMMSFAWDGMTSFSISPLRIVTITGFIVFLISLILSIYVLSTYLSGKAIVGWVSTVLPMYFLGGIQLLCIGIIGEYIGKIYKEVKNRPRYLIDKKLD